MMVPQILTYADALEHLHDYSRHSHSATQATLRSCIHSALREMNSSHNWNYLYKHCRINLVGTQTTGTVVYDHTGGTYERQLTLTGATWPTDAIYYRIRFGDGYDVCEIADRKSDTVVTLDVELNPGEDVASTTYTLFRSVYPLPNDFQSMAGAWGESAWRLGEYIPPEEWMVVERYTTETGDIKYHTIMGLPDAIGTMGLFVWPPESAASSLDFRYQRRSRQLRYSGYDTTETAGTISTTAGSATVSGSSTTFASNMEGSLIRISNNTTLPTGMAGSHPWTEERSVWAVASTTSLTLDQAAEYTASGVAYRVVDPIDIDQAAHNAFLTCCRRQLAMRLNMKNRNQIDEEWREALHEAKCAQNPQQGKVVIGRRAVPWVRFADRCTIGDDVE